MFQLTANGAPSTGFGNFGGARCVPLYRLYRAAHERAYAAMREHQRGLALATLAPTDAVLGYLRGAPGSRTALA